MPSIPIGRRQQAGALTVLLCLTASGCGGFGGTDSPSSGKSGSSSQACPQLAGLSNTFEAAVKAIGNGGNPNQVQGSLAGFKDQYLQTLHTLQTEAPASADDLSTAMTGLQNAASRLGPQASPARVKSTLNPHVEAVRTAIDKTETKLDCPS